MKKIKLLFLPHLKALKINFSSSTSLIRSLIWRLWYETIEMLFAESDFCCFLCFLGSSIFVMVVHGGNFGFLIIWSLIICSSVMWSTWRGLRVLWGWKTICCRWLNSFLIVMLLKLKSEFVDISIVVWLMSSLAWFLFLSHDIKHSWFFAAEYANLSIDSIFRKQVAHIFFGKRSSSRTWNTKLH